MDFSANKQDTYEKRIASLPDQPNMQPDELKAYFDSSPEQLRQAHNGLCDALTEATSSTSAAAGLGFQRTAGVPADNVQAAVENVQAQLDAAVMGNIPSGSVTQDKLAQDVRDRFAAIESAAASEASTRASKDSDLQSQINSLNATKCEVYIGSYAGNGADSQYIQLDFAPKAVLLFAKGCAVYPGIQDTNGGLLLLPGIPMTSYDKPAAEISGNGFTVYYNDSFKAFFNAIALHHFIAFK